MACSPGRPGGTSADSSPATSPRRWAPRWPRSRSSSPCWTPVAVPPTWCRAGGRDRAAGGVHARRRVIAGRFGRRRAMMTADAARRAPRPCWRCSWRPPAGVGPGHRGGRRLLRGVRTGPGPAAATAPAALPGPVRPARPAGRLGRVPPPPLAGRHHRPVHPAHWGPFLLLGPVLARGYLGGARAWGPVLRRRLVHRELRRRPGPARRARGRPRSCATKRHPRLPRPAARPRHGRPRRGYSASS